MDNENTFTVSDLMINAIEENPVTFKDTFDQLLHQKIAAELENAKAYVAQNYFGSEDSGNSQEADDEQTDEQTEDENGEDTETV